MFSSSVAMSIIGTCPHDHRSRSWKNATQMISAIVVRAYDVARRDGVEDGDAVLAADVPLRWRAMLRPATPCQSRRKQTSQPESNPLLRRGRADEREPEAAREPARDRQSQRATPFAQTVENASERERERELESTSCTDAGESAEKSQPEAAREPADSPKSSSHT